MVTRQISRSAACFSVTFMPGYHLYKLPQRSGSGPDPHDTGFLRPRLALYNDNYMRLENENFNLCLWREQRSVHSKKMIIEIYMVTNELCQNQKESKLNNLLLY